MTNIFSVSNKTTKLSTLLFSAAFSIIAAASADASRRLAEEDHLYTTPRGVDYVKTEKRVSLRSGSKPAWETMPVSRKRKASALEAPKISDTDLSEDAPVEPSAKRICTEETRDEGHIHLHAIPLNLDKEILPNDDEDEESESAVDTRVAPLGVMEVIFDEEISSESLPLFQASPTHTFQAIQTPISGEGFAQGTAPIYDFGVESFTSTVKRTVKRHATKRNLAIAGGVAGVFGGLTLADYFLTGGVATTTVASFVPNIAQNLTSVAYNASTMCPAPSLMPSFAQTIVPEVVSQASTFVPSFAQTVPSFLNTTVTPSFGPFMSGYAAPVVDTFAQTVPSFVNTTVTNGLVPYVAPYTTSFLSPAIETVATEAVSNGLVPYVAPYTTSFLSPAIETIAPVMTTVAPEATRSIFWGFSNMIFGPKS